MPDINDIENHHLGEHRIRIGKYEGAISSIYRKYTNLFTNLGLSIADYDPEKLFSFYSYPTTNKMAKKLLAQMKAEIFKTISDGITYEWSAANKKNDAVVKRIYKTRRPPKKYNNHNLEALNAFKKRKTNGLNLSDRVWNYTNQFKREIELSLDVALGEGKSAAETGRDIRQYLKKPDMLFRRVRNKKGKLVPSKAMKAYNPGRGVYRSSAQNALRTTTTETNMAYRQSDIERYRQLDFIVGYEVHTSNNHPVPDMCDDLKGKYPKGFMFRGWHPRCRCYITSILKTDAELDADEDNILSGKPVSSKSKNEVTDVPKGFKKWIQDNEWRIKSAKSKPYFIRENFKGEDIDKGLKFKTKNVKLTPSKTKSVLLNQSSSPIKGVPTEIMDISSLKAVMDNYAAKNKNDFARGFKGIGVASRGAEYYMRTDTDGTILINFYEKDGFDAGTSIVSAINKIRKGTSLSQNEEYSIETLWHEILHNKAKKPTILPDIESTEGFLRSAMETTNQLVARHTYSKFLETIGGKAEHQKWILDNGYGYNSTVSNLRKIISSTGINEQEFIQYANNVLINSDYKDVADLVKKQLVKMSKDDRVGFLFGMIEMKQFDQYLRNILH